MQPVSRDGVAAHVRGALARRYADVRARTERLAEPLSAEDQTIQSMADASPTKWHRAHTTWFFETFLLEPSPAGYRPFDPAYRLSLQFLLRGGGAAPSAAPSAACCRAPARPRSRAIAPMSTRRWRSSSAPVRTLARGPDRARPPPRAAASGADPDGHQACTVAEPLAAGLSRRGAAQRRLRRRRSRWLDVAGGLRRDRP